MWAWEAGTGGGEGLLLSFLVTSRPGLPGAAGGSYPLRVVLPWGPQALVCLSVCLSLFKEPFSKKLCPIKTLSFFPLLKPTQTNPQTHSQGRAREEGAAEMKGWAGCWAGSASLLDTPSWIPGPSCSWRSSPITPSPFFRLSLDHPFGPVW